MAHLGVLHAYTSKLTAFEHTPSTSPSSSFTSNIIIWIGGLGDGPLSVRYPAAISKSVPSNWSLAEVLLSSAYDGWGTGSLKRDAKEIAECVHYFRKRLGISSAKIVLMGHSTGCQDIMEYLVGKGSESRPAIDGAILQAGVSDRQAWEGMATENEGLNKSLKETIKLTRKMIVDGEENEILPKKGNKVLEMFESPCTAYRAHSLLAPGGDDDYFSTDLTDSTFANTFGKIPKGTKVMFLWGEKDPYIPGQIDKEGTLNRWAGIMKEGGGRVDEENGGVVEEATHNLNHDADEVVQDLVVRVVRFIEGL